MISCKRTKTSKNFEFIVFYIFQEKDSGGKRQKEKERQEGQVYVAKYSCFRL